MTADGFSYGAPAGAAREVAIVRAIYDAFARRDVDAAVEHVADDFELCAAGTAGRVGRTQPYRGPDGIREYFADADRAWTGLTLMADDIRAVAGSVVVFGAVRATTSAGELVERRVLWTWKLRDGKAVWLGINDFGA